MWETCRQRHCGKRFWWRCRRVDISHRGVGLTADDSLQGKYSSASCHSLHWGPYDYASLLVLWIFNCCTQKWTVVAAGIKSTIFLQTCCHAIVQLYSNHVPFYIRWQYSVIVQSSKSLFIHLCRLICSMCLNVYHQRACITHVSSPACFGLVEISVYSQHLSNNWQ